MSKSWEAVRCKYCGWEAKRMDRLLAVKRICPHCKLPGLVPR